MHPLNELRGITAPSRSPLFPKVGGLLGVTSKPVYDQPER